jgi:hypothetical protein
VAVIANVTRAIACHVAGGVKVAVVIVVVIVEIGTVAGPTAIIGAVIVVGFVGICLVGTGITAADAAGQRQGCNRHRTGSQQHLGTLFVGSDAFE